MTLPERKTRPVFQLQSHPAQHQVEQSVPIISALYLCWYSPRLHLLFRQLHTLLVYVDLALSGPDQNYCQASLHLSSSSLAAVLALPLTTDVAPKTLWAVLASLASESGFVLQFNLYVEIKPVVVCLFGNFTYLLFSIPVPFNSQFSQTFPVHPEQFPKVFSMLFSSLEWSVNIRLINYFREIPNPPVLLLSKSRFVEFIYLFLVIWVPCQQSQLWVVNKFYNKKNKSIIFKICLKSCVCAQLRSNYSISWSVS